MKIIVCNQDAKIGKLILPLTIDSGNSENSLAPFAKELKVSLNNR